MRMQSAFLTITLFLSSLFISCNESSNSSQNDDNPQYILGELQNDPVTLPAGGEIIIDGTLDENAWQSAYTVEFANNKKIMLMYYNGFLYIGLKTFGTPVTTIFLYKDNKVYIMHSSAALGTAIYEYNGNFWKQTQEFTWQCRDYSSSQSAQNERAQFLANEGWLANVGYAGEPTETEYQIAMPEESLIISASALGEPNYNNLFYWPSNVTDASTNMAHGDNPDLANFVPEQWMQVIRPAN